MRLFNCKTWIIRSCLKHLCIPLFLLIATCSQLTNASSEATNLQRLSRAHLEFALSLFRNLAKDTNPSENVVISPHSVAAVLSQLWLGAGTGSTTASQLEEVLYYKDGGLLPEQVHEAFKSSLYTLEDPDYKNVVQTANGVFLQAGLSLRPEYDASLKKYYNSTVDEVDFEHGESFARSIINRWVSKQTDGHISKLLESPLPSHTRLLLVNALALRALWNNSFDPSLTLSNGHFHPNSKSRLQIPMMTGRFNVLLGSSSKLKCRLVELPFRGRRLSMFIMLPDSQLSSSESDTSSRRAAALAHLEQHLTADNLKKLFSTLKEEKNVHIKLPRLRIRHSAPLLDTLMSMGLTDLFDASKSNLSRISDVNELHVSSIAHKTVLELSEQGAKAAAVTATEIQRTHDVGGKYFEVNRPFIFFIWDYHSGALLFIGRVAYPEPLLS